MTTYTIITKGDMLIATVVDGHSIEDAVRAQAEIAHVDVADLAGYHVANGLTLVNELPPNTEIVWESGKGGFLMAPDQDDRIYNYAIR
jgi:hypothetical protein